MASLDEVKAEQDDVSPTPMIANKEAKLRYKSWRKKYRKMRLVFEERMAEANRLFISEQKSLNVARRILEHNDQMLEIILDVNDDPRTPADVRWEIGQQVDADLEVMQKGKSLSDLERRVTHTTAALPLKDVLPDDLLDLDEDDRLPPGYLTVDHEEEYLTALDASLAAIPPVDNLPLNVEAVQPAIPAKSRQLPTDRDFALRHPCSVHNWLKNHQPQVFEAQKDKPDSEKGDDARVKVVGRGKKEKSLLSRQDLQIEEPEEEVGVDSPPVDLAGIGSAKGKKKKEDDAYRPKGGHSRMPKRKREKEDGGEVKGGKKARKSGLSVGEDAY